MIMNDFNKYVSGIIYDNKERSFLFSVFCGIFDMA